MSPCRCKMKHVKVNCMFVFKDLCECDLRVHIVATLVRTQNLVPPSFPVLSPGRGISKFPSKSILVSIKFGSS